MNRERMGVFRTARNAVAPYPSRLIAAQQRSSLNGDMQTTRLCQIRKNRLNMMRIRAWWVAPCLRRGQCQQRGQFMPGFAMIVGSKYSARLRSRVDCTGARGGKRRHFRVGEAVTRFPSRTSVLAFKRSKRRLDSIRRQYTESACSLSEPRLASFH